MEVNGQTVSTRAIVIATGARPTIPRIPGLEQVRYYTSETIWSLVERPEHLVVLGGGPVGCELAQAFARLDCQVTQVVRTGLMGREDADAVALVEAALRADGVRVLTQTDAIRCERETAKQLLVVRYEDGTEEALPFDAILCAVGRTARTEGFGLEELGIPVSPKTQLKRMRGCKHSIPTSTLAATWPGRTSSPTLRRTRAGMHRSMHCLAV